MNTTLTSGQLGLQLKLFDEKGMTPERWNQILSSGLFADLCDPYADLTNREAMRTALKLEVEVKPQPIVRLLEEVGTPIELTAVARFVARDKFVADVNGELPISYLGDNFRANFLDVVETDVPAVTLKQRKLLKSSVDAPILAALGDEDPRKVEKARVALAHVFSYLKSADRSLWFIFYVADAKGSVWAVYAYWVGDGWYVYADPVSDPDGWDAGDRVVSR